MSVLVSGFFMFGGKMAILIWNSFVCVLQSEKSGVWGDDGIDVWG